MEPRNRYHCQYRRPPRSRGREMRADRIDRFTRRLFRRLPTEMPITRSSSDFSAQLHTETGPNYVFADESEKQIETNRMVDQATGGWMIYLRTPESNQWPNKCKRAVIGACCGFILGIVIGILYRFEIADTCAISLVGAAGWGAVWAVYTDKDYISIFLGGFFGGIVAGIVNHSLLIGILDSFEIDTLIGSLYLGSVIGGCFGVICGLSYTFTEMISRFTVISRAVE